MKRQTLIKLREASQGIGPAEKVLPECGSMLVRAALSPSTKEADMLIAGIINRLVRYLEIGE